MAVKRIVSDIKATDVRNVQAFYTQLFDLSVVMDQDWIVTLESSANAPVQISIASQGGSGTKVPDLSIEVDDVDRTYERAKQLGCKIEYDLTNEPWGVRRFYIKDPTGKLLNVLSHSKA